LLFADGQSNAAVPDVQPAALDNELETVLNIVDKEFSIAVAPDSSLAKVRMSLNMSAISFF
jgi:hypothetical protein